MNLDFVTKKKIFRSGSLSGFFENFFFFSAVYPYVLRNMKPGS